MSELTYPANGLTWVRSSFSTGAGGSCVEIAHLDGGGTLLRSSTAPANTLAFPRSEWLAFLDGVKDGEFDGR
jgi:hypothetical protein